MYCSTSELTTRWPISSFDSDLPTADLDCTINVDWNLRLRKLEEGNKLAKKDILSFLIPLSYLE